MAQRVGRGAVLAEGVREVGGLVGEEVVDGEMQRVVLVGAQHQRPRALTVLEPRIPGAGILPARPGLVAGLRRAIGDALVDRKALRRDQVGRRKVTAQREDHPEGIERPEAIVDDGLVERRNLGMDGPRRRGGLRCRGDGSDGK